MDVKSLTQSARKVVVKIGSNSLTLADGVINEEFMRRVALQMHELIEGGAKIVVVSSGAATAGASTIDKWTRKKDINFKQALCAIGQVELMRGWRTAFENVNLHVAQLLFTREDFETPHRRLNMRNTLFTLIDEKVVPIVNENDSVASDEISIGDNDNLSALTSTLWDADLLILLSDVDGVYSDDPKLNEAARKIDTVENVDEVRRSIKIGPTNMFGTGGITTKLEAAELATKFGIDVVLCSKLDGDGTLFKGVK
jgi:glutamate 5-kinase